MNHRRLLATLLASTLAAPSATLAFQPSNRSSAILSRGETRALSKRTIMASSTTSTPGTSSNTDDNAKDNKSYLYVPSERDDHYKGNVAKYLLDLNQEKATFDFCGGMMFQLVLTDKLQSHLQTIASNPQQQQPTIHDASMPRMSKIPNYNRSNYADNINIFHGRELRKIPNANGGMGFVLQLSYADPSSPSKAVDPQGWTSNEIAGYDGWGHDAGRQWRKASMYEDEGVKDFSTTFGKESFGLHHRFYLHYDNGGRMWLSAEDGCEGVASEGRSLMGKLGGILFGM